MYETAEKYAMQYISVHINNLQKISLHETMCKLMENSQMP